MDETCTVITPRDVTAALNSLDELDRRLTQAKIADDEAREPVSSISYVRGDFGADTVNLLRSEFARLWRVAEINAVANVFYCASDMPGESAHTKGDAKPEITYQSDEWKNSR